MYATPAHVSCITKRFMYDTAACFMHDTMLGIVSSCKQIPCHKISGTKVVHSKYHATKPQNRHEKKIYFCAFFMLLEHFFVDIAWQTCIIRDAADINADIKTNGAYIMIYKNFTITETKSGMLTANVNGKKVSRKNYAAMQNAINKIITVPNSNRGGKSHKSKLGVFTANVLAAYCTALINRFDTILCLSCGFDFGKTIDSWTCDHVRPIADFDRCGEKRNHGIDNLAILCRRCQAIKSDKPAETVWNAETLKLVSDVQRDAAKILLTVHVTAANVAKLFAMQSRKFAKLYRGGMYLRIFHK